MQCVAFRLKTITIVPSSDRAKRFCAIVAYKIWCMYARTSAPNVTGNKQLNVEVRSLTHHNIMHDVGKVNLDYSFSKIVNIVDLLFQGQISVNSLPSPNG